MYLSEYICINLRIYTYIETYVYIHICIYMYIYVYMCVYLICTNIYIYIYMYIYMYIYTGEPRKNVKDFVSKIIQQERFSTSMQPKTQRDSYSSRRGSFGNTQR
jgi:hypothetical protein